MKFLLVIYLTFPGLGQQIIKESEFNSIESCQIKLHEAMTFYGRYYDHKHISGACKRVG
jgi:hypothetical protein